jgi:hypothetical protein
VVDCDVNSVHKIVFRRVDRRSALLIGSGRRTNRSR